MKEIIPSEQLPYLMNEEVKARIHVQAGDRVGCPKCGLVSYEMTKELEPGSLVRAKHFSPIDKYPRAIDGEALECPDCGMELFSQTKSGKHIIFIKGDKDD